jgi:hypothetical protein
MECRKRRALISRRWPATLMLFAMSVGAMLGVLVIVAAAALYS